MPAIRDSTYNYISSTATTIVVPMPACVEGDLLIAVLSSDTGSPTWSCAGWTQVFSVSNTCSLAVMRKYAGASEPAEYTFTSTVSETHNGAIISIRDTDVTGASVINNYATANLTTAKAMLPTTTTSVDNCLLLFLGAISVIGVPNIIEGPCTLIYGKDGSAHADAISWGFQKAAGATPNNVGISCMVTPVGITGVVAIAPPAGGATVIPTYCVSDSSIYVSPFTGAAYNGNAALINTITTDFGTVLNGKTLAAGGTTYTRADQGINSYHAMANVMGVVTSGSWAGDVCRFAAGNKPNVTNKNILFHIQPYLPVDIQTTDSVTLSGVLGVAVGLCSTANSAYRMWHVAGANTPWGFARQPVIIHPSNTSGRIQNTGTLNEASIYSIGLAVSGKVVAANWIFGSVWITDTTVLAGGISGEPINIPGIVNTAATGHERMSVMQQGSSQMMVLQKLQFGNGGTNPTYFDLDSTAIEFPRQYNKLAKQVNYCSIDNMVGITYYPGSGDTIKHTNSIISSASKFFWGFHASSDISANYDFNGLTVLGAGGITLKTGLPLVGITFGGCDSIDSAGAYFTSCIFDKTQLVIDSVTEMNNVINCSFTDNLGSALKLTTVGTYAFNNAQFSNNAYDVENSVVATLVSSYSTQDNTTNLNSVTGISSVGQSINGNSGTLSSVQFYLQKVGNPTGNIQAKIYAASGSSPYIPSGPVLATSDSILANNVGTGLGVIKFQFTDVDCIVLANGTNNYVAVLEYTLGDATNYIKVAYHGTSPSHSGNYSEYISSWSGTLAKDLYHAVYTGAIIIINCQNGANPTTYNNSGNGSTELKNVVTLIATCKNEFGNAISGVKVRIETYPSGILITEGTTNSSGIYQDSNYNYLGDTNIKVITRLKGYKNNAALDTIKSTGLSVPFTMITDRAVNLP